MREDDDDDDGDDGVDDDDDADDDGTSLIVFAWQRDFSMAPNSSANILI